MTSLFLSEIVLERMFFSILEHSLLLVIYITMINQFLYILANIIEVFGGVFVLSRCFLDFSVGVRVFVIGLSQIYSFFSLYIYIKHLRSV